jgi:hypothetical protein
MPRQYPTSFRDDMVRRMLAGESMSDLVFEPRVPTQTLHQRKHPAIWGQPRCELVKTSGYLDFQFV